MGQRNRIYNSGSRVIIIGISLGLMSCFNSANESEREKPAYLEVLESNIQQPAERDYAEIRQSGVLRMITSYSSNSYFLYQGIQSGFEYELVKNFAKENNLALEVVILGENDNPYDILNSGEGDIIANNYTITDERKKLVSFSRPYNIVDEIVVYSEELNKHPEEIADLEDIDIAVRRNSSYYARLKELQNEGHPVNIRVVSNDLDTEALLSMVSAGTYMATVADDNIFEASNKYMRGLVRGPVISKGDSIAWAIRKNAPDLEAQLNKYLYKHFRFSHDGTAKRSEFLNVLRQRYFEGSSQIAAYFQPEYTISDIGIISPYDSLIQAVADEYDLDWVMLTSMAAQESKFNQFSESWAGAVGIMQVLPRFSRISVDSLFIPEVNIREGARILREHLNHYDYMDEDNQWRFALAAYNAGQGHVADARRLAIDQNKNPNEWKNVSDALLKLMQQKYYQNARYGFSRGIETVRYVNEITNRNNTYLAILALSRHQNMANAPGPIGLKMLKVN